MFCFAHRLRYSFSLISRPRSLPLSLPFQTRCFPELSRSLHEIRSLTTTASRPTQHGTTTAVISENGAAVQVKWPDHKLSRFGSFWLRDHCKCSECWHAQTRQRLHDTFTIDVNISATSVSVSGEKIELVWNNGHSGVYEAEWLRRHSYDPHVSAKASPSIAPKFLWNNDAIKAVKPPSVSYHQVMQTTEGLAEWLRNIEVYGFSWVNGVPVSPERTQELAERIAFIRETHYGRFWDFTDNMAHGDTAYTQLALGGHTDTSYFTDPIGLQLFHLLEHTGTGGETLLIDGFHLADILKQRHPKEFETLTTFKVPTHSAGDEHILMTPTPHAGYPIIQADASTGKVFQIRFNNYDRSVLSGKWFTRAQIDDFYSALRVWYALISSKQAEFWTKMTPGNALVVDNWRVFHGRSAFTGHRRLCGAYINWDDYQSRVHTVLGKNSLKEDL